MIIDTHTHIWDNLNFPNMENRYIPDYLFTNNNLEDIMQKYNIQKAVLIQPSFLGNDNSLILKTIRGNKKKYRGVIVIDDFYNCQNLESLLTNYNNLGIKGIRFNLLEKELPNFKQKKYCMLFSLLVQLNWHLEIHANENDICTLLKDFNNNKLKIVFDHFARPQNEKYSKEFISLLNSNINIYIKLSGTYRFNNYPITPYVNTLLEILGKSKLLWGSDCPFTKFEDKWEYRKSLDLLMKNKLLCDYKETFDNNAKELYHWR